MAFFHCLRLAAPVATVLLVPMSLSAHHSNAYYDRNTNLTLSGEVTQVRYVNPHVNIYLDTVNNAGDVEEWRFELQSPGVLSQYGWSRDSVKAGDRIIAFGHPLASRNANLAEGVSFTLPGGEVLATNAAVEGPPAVDVSIGATPAENLDGVWKLADRGGIDGPPFVLYPPTPPEIRSEFPGMSSQSTRFIPILNDAGKAVARSYENAATDNPWCSPAPFFLSHYVEARNIEFENRSDQLVMRMSGEEQVIHIGAEHPPEDQLFKWGHAVGEWTNDVLRIDIRNFEPNPWGIARGLPSGSQKNVTHVFRWREDRTAIDIDTTINDPEFMTQPFAISSSLFHVPDLEVPPAFECSQESAISIFEASPEGPPRGGPPPGGPPR